MQIRYKCKTPYTKEFVVNNYYYMTSVNKSDKYKYIIIHDYIFIDTQDNYIKPFIYDYFYSEKELRKEKLEKLYEIQMQKTI